MYLIPVIVHGKCYCVVLIFIARLPKYNEVVIKCTFDANSCCSMLIGHFVFILLPPYLTIKKLFFDNNSNGCISLDYK